MYCEAFFTTIFLVNLMIAKMSSTYPPPLRPPFRPPRPRAPLATHTPVGACGSRARSSVPRGSYELIRSESVYYRAVQRCEFVIEFKDQRGLPTPFNLLALLTVPVRRVARYWVRRRRAQSESEQDKESGFAVPMGHNASMRLGGLQRHYARSYDRQQKSAEATQTETLDTMRDLSRRCEALEAANASMAGDLKHVRRVVEEEASSGSSKREGGEARGSKDASPEGEHGFDL